MTEPTDHLANLSGYTHELLAALTDDQLAEQAAYFDLRIADAGSNTAHYHWTVQRGHVRREQEDRAHRTGIDRPLPRS